MTTTLTPPPQPPLPVQPPQPPHRPSSAGRVVAILAIAVGVVIVLGTVFSAVVSTVGSALVRTESRSITDAASVRDLEIDLAAGTLTVEFVEGQEDAQLEVTSSSGVDGWTFSVDDGTLHVASPDRTWFGPRWWWGGTAHALLRLPASLQGDTLDASVDVSAGEFTVDGDFGDLEVDLGAGRATVDGSARELSLDVSAGAADLELADVRTAELSVSAGAVDARLTGDQPQSVTVDVSAGSLDLRVPEGPYDVRSTVDAGRFEDRLGSTPGASSTISVQVSAGSARLHAG